MDNKKDNHDEEEGEIEGEGEHDESSLDFEDETGFHDEELDEDEESGLLTEESIAFLDKQPTSPAEPAAAPAAKPAATKPAAPIKKEEPAVEKSIAAEAPAEEPKQLLAPREVPLNVVVEVGRVQMNVEKLLALEPGNLLELNIHPEQGVDLVINSKKVGKGELIRIGDNLGVRILEIGS